VMLGRTDPALAEPHEFSYPDYEDVQAQRGVFRDLAAYVSNTVNLTGGGEGSGARPERIWIDGVTANYFSVLGVEAALGRTFLPDEDQGELAHPVVVLSHEFWQRHFGGDPRVVGDTIRLNNRPLTIVGVAPPTFHGVNPIIEVDGYAPINQVWPPEGELLRSRTGTFLVPFGRLQPGVSIAAARAAVTAKMQQIEKEHPQTNRGVGAVLIPETQARPAIAISGSVPKIALVFMTLVGLVLLVACANVANLLLARVATRQREMAIRAALGAGRWRLVRQSLAECVLLGLLGAAGALLLAQAALHALTSVKLALDAPIRWGVAVDWRVFAFTFAVALSTAVIAALVPALRGTRADLQDALKSGSRTSSGGQHRLQRVLVVAQIAVSLVVLVCAALFSSSTRNASRLDLGFRVDHLLMLSAQLRDQGYDSTRGKAFTEEIVRRVSALPGVRAVTTARYIPFGYNNDIEQIFPDAPGAQLPESGFGFFGNFVGPRYFETMGMPLLAGRDFAAQDDPRAPRVAVVNAAFVKRVWPGDPVDAALGRRFRIDKDGAPSTIIGIVRDAQYNFLGETPKPFWYLPQTQHYTSSLTLHIHTTVDPTSVAPAVRAAFSSLDPTLPLFDIRTMQEHLMRGRALLFPRLGAAFAAVFGLLALGLAAVGVYGVVSYAVTQRTREIGIRMALGARLAAVLGLVVRQGAGIAGTGIIVGLLAAVGVSRLLGSLLYGVQPTDPVIFGGVAVLLGAVALGASYLPARRAAKVDPLVALRAE
jgi:macrolide transport system ATP-binding/permease protein